MRMQLHLLKPCSGHTRGCPFSGFSPFKRRASSSTRQPQTVALIPRLLSSRYPTFLRIQSGLWALFNPCSGLRRSTKVGTGAGLGLWMALLPAFRVLLGTSQLRKRRIIRNTQDTRTYYLLYKMRALQKHVRMVGAQRKCLQVLAPGKCWGMSISEKCLQMDILERCPTHPIRQRFLGLNACRRCLHLLAQRSYLRVLYVERHPPEGFGAEIPIHETFVLSTGR